MKLEILKVTPYMNGFSYTLKLPDRIKRVWLFRRILMSVSLKKDFTIALSKLNINIDKLRVYVFKGDGRTLNIYVTEIDMSSIYQNKEDGELFAKTFKEHFNNTDIIQIPA